MYKAPSIKRLTTYLGISEESARKVRGIIKGNINPLSYPGVKKWARQCYGEPRTVELILAALDEEIGTYGVEGICPEGEIYTRLSYLNTGETYKSTILYNHDTDSFYLGSWGDAVESNGW